MMRDQYGNGYDGRWDMMDGGDGVVAWLMMFLIVALLAAAVVAAVIVIRRLPQTAGGGGMAPPVEGGQAAQRILDERLARGEIDEDEFRRRRAALTEHMT